MSQALPGVGDPPGPRSVELDGALEAARRAGEITLRHLGSPDFELKADRSLVTVADRECEAVIRSVLAARTPGIPVIGEESVTEKDVRGLAALEAVWVVDPIDGTSSFAAGLATYSVSIGLLVRGEPVLGVLYVPRLDEMYCCDRTGPAYFGPRAVRGVLTPETVDERTFLCVTSEAHRGWDVRFPGKVRSLGSTALHVALVARGAAVGSMLRPAPWDIAAVAPILRRAGGELFDAKTGEVLAFAAWTREGGKTRDLLACSPLSLEPLRGFVVRKKR